MQLSISFLVDECLPGEVADAIRAAGYEVLYVGDSAYRRAADAELWRLAAEQRWVLVTRDLDFPLPISPGPLGLIIIRAPDWYGHEDLAELIRDFMYSFDITRIAGSVVVVRPGRKPRLRSLETL